MSCPHLDPRLQFMFILKSNDYLKMCIHRTLFNTVCSSHASISLLVKYVTTLDSWIKVKALTH